MVDGEVGVGVLFEPTNTWAPTAYRFQATRKTGSNGSQSTYLPNSQRLLKRFKKRRIRSLAVLEIIRNNSTVDYDL